MKTTDKKIVFTKEKVISSVFFAILFVIFIVASIFTSRASMSQTIVILFGKVLPISAFAGVFSSLANMCIIFWVVFFGKIGFYSALVILSIQVPRFLVDMFLSPTLAGLPGLFTNLLTLVIIVIIYNRNRQIEKFRETEVERLKEQQMFSQNLFEQTATALVNAIDAKDTYSHGHSLRVAEYSEKIARALGKNDEECYRIYYTALLHDVGKIGIDDSIINKPGRLTNEEYEIIKQHPVMGNQILSSISEYPYLSIGAHYHHERYDGKGYPDRLKGEDIPEVARIISVADAYDAMSSNRSYRNAIPQQLVREEIVKGAGTQFDPVFATIMQHLIDLDTEYEMKERDMVKELAGKNELICGAYRSNISDGINVTQFETDIHFKFSKKNEDATSEESFPAIVMFDSLDGRFHDEERTIEELVYYEYCEIFFDGTTQNRGVRDIRSDIFASERTENKSDGKPRKEILYDVYAVKCDDHVLVKLDDGERCTRITIALPDSSRYVYIGLTGKECRISDVSISKSPTPSPEERIPRIAPKISYIEAPEGDVPNVQINDHRTASTVGIPLGTSLRLVFHTMSLPTARLVWHCPYFVIFTSADGLVDGEGYEEYALVRLDGEMWEDNPNVTNEIEVVKRLTFEGWEAWKKSNKAGFDCTVEFERNGNVITTSTSNLGIDVMNTTTISDGSKPIFVAITGDQVAITKVRVK